MSSSGGSNGVTRYDWNPYMENMWAGGQDGNIGVLGRAINTLNSPYRQYTGDRTANLTQDHTLGMNRIRDIAMNGSEPANAADRELTKIMNGGYVNPWENKDLKPFTQDASMISGEVLGKVAPQQNEFMGMDSAPFNAVLDRGLEKITKAYERGTSADTRKAMNMAGIFGGGAHMKAQDQNEENLGEQLGAYTDQMLNAQYDRSAGLRESDIGRQVGAQQFNIGTEGQNIDRNMLAQQFNLGQAGQNADRQNAMMQFGANLKSGLAENRFGRQMQAIPLGFEAENRGFRTGQALLGIGDIQQNQRQRDLDIGYQDWADANNWERNNINWFGNLLSQAQGGIGGQMTQSQPGYGVNPYAGVMAGGLFGRSMGWF